MSLGPLVMLVLLHSSRSCSAHFYIKKKPWFGEYKLVSFSFQRQIKTILNELDDMNVCLSDVHSKLDLDHAFNDTCMG